MAVNRPRHHRRYRHRRYRYCRNRSKNPSCGMRSRHRQTSWKGSIRFHCCFRYSCCPNLSRQRMTGARPRFAYASSAKSKSAKHRRPRSGSPSSHASQNPSAGCGKPFPVCAVGKPTWLHRHSSPKQATSFIDRSSEMWNFGDDRPLTAVACSTGKVKP